MARFRTAAAAALAASLSASLTTFPSIPAAAPSISLIALSPAIDDAYVQKAIEDWGVPGLSLAVVKDDQVTASG